jgi:hypothetical protein
LSRGADAEGKHDALRNGLLEIPGNGSAKALNTYNDETTDNHSKKSMKRQILKNQSKMTG